MLDPNLQKHLEDISTVKNAFDISNFVKREDKKSDIIYYFKSFQSIRKCKMTSEFSYSKNLYGYGNSSDLVNIGTFAYSAFRELMMHIDLNVDNLGNYVGVNISKMGNSALQNAYNNNNKSITLPSGIVVTGDKNVPLGYGISSAFKGFTDGLNTIEQNLYCVCEKPLITQSEAAGEKFDYCKCCKKEKNDIKLKELFGSKEEDKGPNNGYVWDDIPF